MLGNKFSINHRPTALAMVGDGAAYRSGHLVTKSKLTAQICRWRDRPDSASRNAEPAIHALAKNKVASRVEFAVMKVLFSALRTRRRANGRRMSIRRSRL